MARILVVDDDKRICKVFEEFLCGAGHHTLIASNASEALSQVRDKRPDLVVMDIRMPGANGLEALESIRQIDSDIHVILMTAYGTSQTSIEAMRLGAYDYLIKPVDLHDLKRVINSALEARNLSQELEKPPEHWEQPAMLSLIGSTEQMQEVYKLIGMLATNTLPTLLIGERGVGKHLVARTIHANSECREAPFAAIDCLNLPADDLELEIFGQDEQAPSSTTRLTERSGITRGGTLFLDNIDALPLKLQHRLLRALSRQGGINQHDSNRATGITTRLITATAIVGGLEHLVTEGRFNQQLLQRLHTLPIYLPPLRKRLDDLPALVEHFIQLNNNELGKALRGVDERVIARLRAHHWPGNIGELENVIRRGAVLARGDIITLAELGEQWAQAPIPELVDNTAALELAVQRCLREQLSQGDDARSATPFHDIVRRVETILVHEAIAEASGSQVRAAAILGINRTTLRAKLGR